MYPKDNIFDIYYRIGKRVPFQVKRSPSGLKGALDKQYRYNKEGKTFMVERVVPKGKYGEAFGYCLFNNIRDDDYMKTVYGDIKSIPCAGCGEWVLIDIPGVDLNEVFPIHSPAYIFSFGLYRGKTLAHVYKNDPHYICWLIDNDPYFRVDLTL